MFLSQHYITLTLYTLFSIFNAKQHGFHFGLWLPALPYTLVTVPYKIFHTVCTNNWGVFFSWS